jgi:hypothetical protein
MMEKLTLVYPALGATAELGWPHESWREYANHSLDHDDLPAPVPAPRPALQLDAAAGECPLDLPASTPAVLGGLRLQVGRRPAVRHPGRLQAPPAP